MVARAAKRETEAVGWTEFSGEEGKGVGAGSKTVSPGPASVGRGGEVTWPKSENASSLMRKEEGEGVEVL